MLDMRLPGMSGLDFQAQLAGTHADIPIIFITGHGDVPMSVKAMKAGAVEFLTKPVREQDPLDAVRVALERDRVQREQVKKLGDLKAPFQSLSPRARDRVPGHRRAAEQADGRRTEIERGNREGRP